MTAIRAISDGGEWENYCLELLTLRHGEDLQRIPAERKGDLGIEAFTRSTGLAFQCYFPLEPLLPKARYERQRDKLTKDLRKLETNADDLAKYLGETRLTHYSLMVPLFDWPDLIAHCEARAAALRALELPILDASFTVGVQTDADYPFEKAQLATVSSLSIGVPPIAVQQVVDWAEAEENIGLVGDLERKLKAIGLEANERDDLRQEMLGHYLASEDMMARIREEAPEVWHRFDSRIRSRERMLGVEKLLGDLEPKQRLGAVVKAVADDLQAESSRLVRGDADGIAVGTAAGWLLECPLEF